jgi:MazG family protein
MSDVSRLREIVAKLRGPEGCPWDREQTHESLRAALVEECYETVEAIERSDDANLREELGDLLLHVVMHAHLAGERGVFSFEEIVEGICEKLIRRHPHVFGEAKAGDTRDVLRQWEQIKREEKGDRASVMDGQPASLPALMRAQNAQRKAGRVGFDWEESGPVFEKVHEEIAELQEALAAGKLRAIEEEMGDVLFTMVNLSRKLKVDAETSLAAATSKFIRRFQAVEAEVAAGGRPIEEASPEEMNRLWEKHKAEARSLNSSE